MWQIVSKCAARALDFDLRLCAAPLLQQAIDILEKALLSTIGMLLGQTPGEKE